MTQYFTFGYGTPYRNKYVKMEADTKALCRERMVELYGLKWAFQYDEDKFQEQIDRFGLEELEPGMPAL